MEVDLHVVHRQRVGIVGEVEARRLLVAHGAADQQLGRRRSRNARDAVLPVVEHLEARPDRAGGSRRWRNIGAMRTCRRGHALSTRVPSRPWRSSRSRSTGDHVELVPLGRRPRRRAASPRRTVDRSTYGFTEVPGDARTHAPTTSTDLLAKRRRRHRPCRSPSAGVADGRLVGCTRSMELRWWRGRAEPDEVEIGGTWLAADAQRTPLNTEAKLLLLTHAFDVWGVDRVALGHRRPQRAQPARRSSASAPASRASCATTGRRWSAGEAGPAPRHGAVRDHRRRLAGRRGEACEQRLR